MKKRILSIALTLTLLLGVCGVASAAGSRGTRTRDRLQSYGTIQYGTGDDSVVIRSDDLYQLADQLDLVKSRTVDQLAELNTFFTFGSGISLRSDQSMSVTHVRPSGTQAVDPLTMGFDALLEGIAASQSISKDTAAYGYMPGARLFKRPDGGLTTDAATEGAIPVSVVPATPENLSAGTAAWVDGRLILGTGRDNATYYASGCANGSSGDGSAPPEEDDGGGGGADEVAGVGLDKALTINMRGEDKKKTSYLMPEDMTDVLLFFYSNSSVTPLFDTLPSDPEVAPQKVYSWTMKGVNNLSIYCSIYYVPELKQGTVVKGFSGHSFLFTAKSSSGKGGHITPVNLRGYDSKQTSYLVESDIHDVFLIRKGSSSAPTFEALPENPLVAYKRVFYGQVGWYSPTDSVYRNYPSSIYYIPELKAGSVIRNFGDAYLFY